MVIASIIIQNLPLLVIKSTDVKIQFISMTYEYARYVQNEIIWLHLLYI